MTAYNCLQDETLCNGCLQLSANKYCLKYVILDAGSGSEYSNVDKVYIGSV